MQPVQALGVLSLASLFSETVTKGYEFSRKYFFAKNFSTIHASHRYFTSAYQTFVLSINEVNLARGVSRLEATCLNYIDSCYVWSCDWNEAFFLGNEVHRIIS